MKAVAYLRISQGDETVENQRIAINDFAKRKGIEIVAWFKDEEVSRTVPPREREGYRAMLKFCKDNDVKTIIFFDISRFSGSVEEGLLELKRLAEEGFNFYFAGMDFLNYDIDPMMKKKIIMDFLWFAEVYVEDVKKRTKVAMERLKREGKVYHRPRLIHYIALYLSRKNSFNELTREDIENAKEYMRNMLKPYIDIGVPLYRLHKLILERLHDMYSKLQKAPRSYDAIKKLLQDLELIK